MHASFMVCSAALIGALHTSGHPLSPTPLTTVLDLLLRLATGSVSTATRGACPAHPKTHHHIPWPAHPCLQVQHLPHGGLLHCTPILTHALTPLTV